MLSAVTHWVCMGHAQGGACPRPLVESCSIVWSVTQSESFLSRTLLHLGFLRQQNSFFSFSLCSPHCLEQQQHWLAHAVTQHNIVRFCSCSCSHLFLGRMSGVCTQLDPCLPRARLQLSSVLAKLQYFEIPDRRAESQIFVSWHLSSWVISSVQALC